MLGFGATLFSWIIGPIGRWVALTILGGVFLAWVRADARAPYANQVSELETIIKKRDETAKRDRQLVKDQTARAERLQNELEILIAKANSDESSCRLSQLELDRLHKLAKTN